ncbi:MAG: MerR family transcriptional regulator [Clostridiales bacterium]|nr:MerR family transcriptional regulator [Clostridiales bacterium]
MCYSIHEVSEKTGISPYVLRFYEKEGLLPHIHRSEGGIRYYTEEDIDLLGLICCLKKTGMQLKEIRTFVQLSDKGPETLRERCAILKQQQDNVQNQMKELQKSYEKVSHKLAYFSGLLEAYEGKQ